MMPGFHPQQGGRKEEKRGGERKGEERWREREIGMGKKEERGKREVGRGGERGNKGKSPQRGIWPR